MNKNGNIETTVFEQNSERGFGMAIGTHAD